MRVPGFLEQRVLARERALQALPAWVLVRVWAPALGLALGLVLERVQVWARALGPALRLVLELLVRVPGFLEQRVLARERALQALPAWVLVRVWAPVRELGLAEWVGLDP